MNTESASIKPGKTERLLNLLLALMSTRQAISRSEIRECVAGYEKAVSDESFERMFERDKDELRSMGIPIQTVRDASDAVLGYRISSNEYGYVDINLTASDLSVLGIAAQVWDEAVLGVPAQTALRKIEARLGEETAKLPPTLSGLVKIRAQDSKIPQLLRASRERKVVTFTYQPLQGESRRRSLEPWFVVCRSGNWYTTGYDLERKDARTFKLARIVGAIAITATDSTHEKMEPTDISIDIPSEREEITATIGVLPRAGSSMRRKATSVTHSAGVDYLTVTADPDDLVEWVLRSLSEIQSISAGELRDLVLDTIRNISTIHEPLVVHHD